MGTVMKVALVMFLLLAAISGAQSLYLWPNPLTNPATTNPSGTKRIVSGDTAFKAAPGSSLKVVNVDLTPGVNAEFTLSSTGGHECKYAAVSRVPSIVSKVQEVYVYIACKP